MIRCRSLLCASVLLAALAPGCEKAPPPAAAPATEKPKTESDLARTTLSPEAAASLRVRVEPAPSRSVQQTLSLPGWVMVPQGCEVTITAPVAGYVREAPVPPGQGLRLAAWPGAVPVAGLPVAAQQELLALEPVLSPVEQIQLATLRRGVEGELAKAVESLTVARSELQRVLELRREGLRQQQDVEQAQARLKHAAEDLAVAEDKLKLFAPAGSDGNTHLRLQSIRAPRAGTVLAVHVSPGQYVQAAAPLLTMADLSHLWLRVPVPEYDLPRVDRLSPATVVLKGATSGGRQLRPWARPIALVPQVDPVRHTADLVYDLSPCLHAAALADAVAALAGGPAGPLLSVLPKRPTPFAKDQMVTVLVPVGERHQETVVPYAAVVFDAYAGAWIYLERGTAGAGERVYERRRVELGPALGADVVVRPPLTAGERVVTQGAAALFSREFHKPPVTPATRGEVEDDD